VYGGRILDQYGSQCQQLTQSHPISPDLTRSSEFCNHRISSQNSLANAEFCYEIGPRSAPRTLPT